MKTKITLKEFGALPSGAVEVTDPTVPKSPESFTASPDKNSERFREWLHHRYSARFRCETPYERSGINE